MKEMIINRIAMDDLTILRDLTFVKSMSTRSANA